MPDGKVSLIIDVAETVKLTTVKGAGGVAKPTEPTETADQLGTIE
jgi:hypothetical protein